MHSTAIHSRARILLEHTVGAAVVNLLLNGGIAWLTFRGADAAPLWGVPGIAVDALATCFLLPFLMGLIVSRLVRGDVRRGRVSGIARDRLPRSLALLPTGARRRSLVLGVVVTLVLGPAVLAALIGLGIAELRVSEFVVIKAVCSAGLAALVAPVIVWTALGDPVPEGVPQQAGLAGPAGDCGERSVSARREGERL